MPFASFNPATGQRIARRPSHSRAQAFAIVARAERAAQPWRSTALAERARTLRAVGRELRRRRDDLAALLTAEVGKPIRQSRAEIEKCAAGCEYFAAHAARALRPQHPIGAPRHARVVFEPLGIVLGIMPWNFPFWQTFRAAAPALMAGNVLLFKPAPSTAGCALAIEAVFDAVAPKGLLRTLLVETDAVATLIADARVRGVTLTGSTRAGRAVAALAGGAMKPGVFELGGSDAYLVLDDADLDHAAAVCAQARLVNSGQSCIAAKRFIVLAAVRGEFERRFVAHMTAAKVGDPTDPATDVGPLARADLCDQLHRQVKRSVQRGARVLLGGAPAPGAGFYYEPTVLSRVRPGMPAFDEELFGPVAAVISARDETEAIALANRSIYGLGAAVFTRDRRRARRIAEQLEAGFIVTNDFVRSDPTLPFGGVKQSGYGRELGDWGVTSFVNVKTVIG
ncbi:NAD-dependent succinate-semialdehyde dehydrogenase [Opitutus terrae]|uniref:Aldehyde Dehydrogenase n=1 Tax=Opitutus terrae (strain DSM 11246 / JCM 15787 / PB90-1) TaxID=452637 RepID=B1ZP31_OPITP|nr:NAD-dependent succinate-semialdehyde dehydrogenase [Opitutus terrae]ACB77517.1 Aldehyde Dehydrogenase [Opitutus terrae PB90-1]